MIAALGVLVLSVAFLDVQLLQGRDSADVLVPLRAFQP